LLLLLLRATVLHCSRTKPTWQSSLRHRLLGSQFGTISSVLVLDLSLDLLQVQLAAGILRVPLQWLLQHRSWSGTASLEPKQTLHRHNRIGIRLKDHMWVTGRA
jgi:hypothetical protein